MSQLEKWVKATNVFHSYKNASQLEKWFTVRKMRHRQQKGDKYVTVKKVGPS